jgi:hypothetical protein
MITTVTRAGIAEVFTKGPTRWSWQASVHADDAAQLDFFGAALALGTGTLVVGAPGNLLSEGSQTGRVFVYSGSGATWTKLQTLTASDAAGGDRFGASLALSADTLVIGAPDDDDGGSNSGAAYVFTRSGSTWTQQQKLVASDAAASAGFGSAVAATSADRVLVSATGSEQLYVFTRTAGVWTQSQVQRPCTGSIGQSLAASGDLAVALETNSWVFDLADPDTSCVP